MPYSFFEVEHTTDIQNSLLKFNDLRDFYSKFYIIAAKERERDFHSKLSYSAFSELKNNNRVEFRDYNYIANLHSTTSEKYKIRSL
jgi:hypothetical protein